MGQDIFDVIIVRVLTAFAARGFWAGFVGEVAGLLSIVGGFWVSHHFHTVLAPHLTFTPTRQSPSRYPRGKTRCPFPCNSCGKWGCSRCTRR